MYMCGSREIKPMTEMVGCICLAIYSDVILFEELYERTFQHETLIMLALHINLVLKLDAFLQPWFRRIHGL